jgi:hypothetical protein
MNKIGAAGTLLAALVAMIPLGWCSPAAADEDARNEQTDESALALLAGGAVTFVSLATGGLMIGLSDNELVKNGGLLGSQAGMALAPFVAHAVVGETKRGVWWSLPLLAPLATNGVLTGLYPSIIKHAPAGIQYATFISFTISIVGGTLGVLDAVRVGERRPKKSAASWSVVPIVGEGTAGAMFSWSLQ